MNIKNPNLSELGGIKLDRGTKKRVLLEAPGTISIPSYFICGAQPGPTVLFSAGIHGCEYPGIQALVELGKSLDPVELKGNLILITIFNLPGFLGRRPYVCPADEKEKNFNHIFPGSPDGTLADITADFIMQNIVRFCDFHVDLHSGDMVEELEEYITVCNSPDQEVKDLCRKAAACTSFRHCLISGGRREFYNSSAIDLGVPSLLFERGGCGMWTEEEVQANISDLMSLLRHFEMLEGAPEDHSGTQILCPRSRWLEASESGLFYRFVRAGQEIIKGDKLGEIRDIWDREVLEEFYAEFDGRVKIACNTLGISAKNDTFMYVQTC